MSVSSLTTLAVSTTAHAATTASYEAESSTNTIAGGARIATCSSCSGGHKVGYVGKGGTLQFNKVNASAAGTATVTITYLSGNARSAMLSVNGGSAKTLNFTSTGSFNTTGTMKVTVTLKSGSNTLKLANSSAYAPDFDKISVTSGSSSGGSAPTAAQLLAKVTSCSQISNGKYATDEGSPRTVSICGKKGAVFWKADMDVDCDGQRTTHCNENTDCCFQNDTTFHQSDGKPLSSENLPYIVIPSESSIFRYSQHNIQGGAVVAVIYNNKLEYAVFGDTGPTTIIGEASYATAKSLGINPSALDGGVDSGVTYIVFEGTKANPIQDHNSAVSVGEAAARAFINNN